MRHKNSERKRGQNRKVMGDVDWHVPIDTERAQVPAKALILGKLSVVSLNFEQFCSEDNPNCTCTFDEDEDGDLEVIVNPSCPVRGHSEM
jgi:hypothetical protein